MDKVRYYIESDAVARTEIFPVFSGEMSWTKEENALYYVYGVGEKLKVKDNGYNLIRQHIDTECKYFYLEIETLCGGSYSLHWRGKFTILGSKENEDRCWFEIEPVPDTKITCFEEAIKEENNFFPTIGRVEVSAVGGNYEEAVCTRFSPTGGLDFAPISDCLTDAETWTFKSNEVVEVLFGGNEQFQQVTNWHRETYTTACVGGQPVEPGFGSGWNLLVDNCNSVGTATWWRRPSTVNGDTLGPYTNGVRLSDVLEEMNQVMGCGFTLVSNFFNINPDGSAPSNDPYDFAASSLANITMHQKSDIKDKDASNASTSNSWNIKLEELVEDLRIVFNVYFDPSDETILRIEHYSYFTSGIGLDRSTENMVLEFDYQVKDNTREERFFFVDEQASDDFLSQHIRYTCGTETKEHRCKLFSTDLAYIENPRNAENISSERFVLIANQNVSGQLVLIDENRPLSWPVLHDRLHRHGRLFKSGSLGGSETTFLSWLPYIKQVPFKTDLCCSEPFDAKDLVVTRKGNATVEEASYNLYTKRLEIQPAY